MNTSELEFKNMNTSEQELAIGGMREKLNEISLRKFCIEQTTRIPYVNGGTSGIIDTAQKIYDFIKSAPKTDETAG